MDEATKAGIVPGSIWQHFKGTFYEVLHVATCAENGADNEPVIVYRAVDGDGRVWTRGFDDWTTAVYRNGDHFPRFALVGKARRRSSTRPPHGAPPGALPPAEAAAPLE